MNYKDLSSDIKRWDNIASFYSKKIDSGDVLREHLLNKHVSLLLGDLQGKLILDAGCGEGYFSDFLNKNGASVIGIDASQNLIDIAKKKYGENKTLSFLKHDLREGLDFTDSHFDKILSNLTLMDFDPIENAISEFGRVLKHNGLLVFSILHPLTTAGKLRKSLVEKLFFKTPHYDVSEYQTIRRIDWKITGIKHKTSVYHRPISYYVNLLLKNHFLLDAIEEPVLDSSSLQRKRNNFLKLCTKIPPFLIIKASRN